MAFQPSNAVYQGAESKIRAIDDGKRSALNLAYTTNFKLELYDVDTLAALVASVADSLQFGKVSFDMEDNTTYTVPVHKRTKDSWNPNTRGSGKLPNTVFSGNQKNSLWRQKQFCIQKIRKKLYRTLPLVLKEADACYEFQSS